MAAKRGFVCGQPVRWQAWDQRVYGRVNVHGVSFARYIDVSVLFHDSMLDPSTLLNIVTAQIEADLAVSVSAYNYGKEQRNDHSLHD